MPRIDNEKFYKSAIEIHGTSAKGVNWSSKENQVLRFKIILEMLPDDLQNYSLIDAGCGFGDFFSYMTKKKKLPKKYIGIDSLLDMYSIASVNTGCEILIADIVKDTLPKADYYICSGAMNVLNEFETHLFIRNCFNACHKAFIFNILHGESDSETYNYFSTKKLQQIVKDLKVKKVVFSDNYMEDDITVGLFK